MPRREPKLSAKQLYWAAIHFQMRALDRNFGVLAPLLNILRWQFPDQDGSITISGEQVRTLREAQDKVIEAVRQYESGERLAKALGLAGEQGKADAHGRSEQELEDAIRAVMVARLRRELGIGVTEAAERAADLLDENTRTIQRAVNKVVDAWDNGEISRDMPEEDAYEAGLRKGMMPEPTEARKLVDNHS